MADEPKPAAPPAAAAPAPVAAAPAPPAQAWGPTPPDEKKSNAMLDNLLKAVGLNWVRPLVYKLGGRKMVVGGGGLAVINEVIKSDLSSTGMIVVSVCCAVISVGTAISIAIEDGKKGNAQAS